MVGNPLSTGATSEMKKLDSPHFVCDSSRIAKKLCRLQIRRNNKADLPDFGMDFAARSDLYCSDKINEAISTCRLAFRFPICKMNIKRPSKRERFDLSTEVRWKEGAAKSWPAPAAPPRGAGLAAMALAASERASRRMSRIAFHSFRESSVV